MLRICSTGRYGDLASREFSADVSRENIAIFVKNTVKTMLPGLCAPIFLGMGIAPTKGRAVYLAKNALCRPMDRRNLETDLAEFEKLVLSEVNTLGHGPSGYGGNCTALAANVEADDISQEKFFFAVNISCHACRVAKTKI